MWSCDVTRSLLVQNTAGLVGVADKESCDDQLPG